MDSSQDAVEALRGGLARVVAGLCLYQQAGQLPAQILKAGTRVSYPNTFLAKGLPFTRTSRKLRVEHGPSTGSLFLGQSQYGDAIRDEVLTRMNEQLMKGIERALDSAARGYGK
jgi:hypothetical protein